MNFFIDYMGLIIALIALFLSIFTYFKHDSKIKKQSALINSYEIEKINEERERNKKAVLEGLIIENNKGTRTLRISNYGMAVARKVKITLPSVKGLIDFGESIPNEIRAKKSIDIKFLVSEITPELITIKFEWSDEYSSQNTDVQDFQI